MYWLTNIIIQLLDSPAMRKANLINSIFGCITNSSDWVFVYIIIDIFYVIKKMEYNLSKLLLVLTKICEGTIYMAQYVRQELVGLTNIFEFCLRSAVFERDASVVGGINHKNWSRFIPDFKKSKTRLLFLCMNFMSYNFWFINCEWYEK